MNDLTRFYSQDLSDPAELGWPPTLAIELALRVAPPQELKAEYGLSDDEWEALQRNPAFLTDLAAACDMVRKEGMSFKLKARLQAEELLKTSWRLIHAPSDQVPSSVKADLIKATARWAGYDNKEAAAGASAVGFSININL